MPPNGLRTAAKGEVTPALPPVFFLMLIQWRYGEWTADGTGESNQDHNRTIRITVNRSIPRQMSSESESTRGESMEGDQSHKTPSPRIPISPVERPAVIPDAAVPRGGRDGIWWWSWSVGRTVHHMDGDQPELESYAQFLLEGPDAVYAVRGSLGGAKRPIPFQRLNVIDGNVHPTR